VVLSKCQTEKGDAALQSREQSAKLTRQPAIIRAEPSIDPEAASFSPLPLVVASSMSTYSKYQNKINTIITVAVTSEQSW
jgi:hypothetical protein